MRKQTDCARFATLQDRRLAEEGPLSEAERAFVADHGQRCCTCGLEQAGLEGLRRVGEDQEASELTDAAVSREVERVLERVRVAPRRRPWLRPLPVGLVGAGAAAALALVLLLPTGSTRIGVGATSLERRSTPAAEARLTLVAGRVQVDDQPATVRSRLAAGQRVRVGRGGRAVVSFADGTTALISEGTHATFAHSPGGTTYFVLRGGEATFRVTPRSTGGGVEVLAEWGRIEVVGTVFRVTDRADNRRVQVVRGRVRVVLAQGAPVLLEAGQELDAAGTQKQLAQSARRRLRAAMKWVGQLPAQGGGVLSVRAQPGRVRVTVDGMFVGLAPVALVAQSGRRIVAAAREREPWVKREVALASGQRAEVSFDLRRSATASGSVAQVVAQPSSSPSPSASASPLPVPVTRRAGRRGTDMGRRPPVASVGVGATPAPSTPRTDTSSSTLQPAPGVVVPPAAPPTDTVAKLLSLAAQLRAQRSWTRVVAVYRRIIQHHPRTPEAATCLVLMGQVQLRQLRRARAALASFGRYLRLFQSGGLAPEAAWGRIESLRQLGRRQEEKRACQALLTRYPQSIYAARVRSRLRGLRSAGTPRPPKP